jgi:hypothetical protein
MTLKAQGERRSHAGHRLTLTPEESAEIISRARARREEHEVVDIAWAWATISDVTDGRLSKVHDNLVSRFDHASFRFGFLKGMLFLWTGWKTNQKVRQQR